MKNITTQIALISFMICSVVLLSTTELLAQPGMPSAPSQAPFGSAAFAVLSVAGGLIAFYKYKKQH